MCYKFKRLEVHTIHTPDQPKVDVQDIKDASI